MADLPAKPPKDFYYTNRYCDKNRCGWAGKLKTVASQREDDEGDRERVLSPPCSHPRVL